MASKSTGSAQSDKPQKPYPEFRLLLHQNGRWAKNIRQMPHDFGKISNQPDGPENPAELSLNGW